MKNEVLADADAVVQAAAAIIAAEARAAFAACGRFIVAVSGGDTPWQMLRLLAREDVPWDGLHVIQVDERIAPLGHPDQGRQRMTLTYRMMKQFNKGAVHVNCHHIADRRNHLKS